MRLTYSAPADRQDHRGEDIVVVDDFYADPDALRRYALGLNYPEPGAGTRYPGFESDRSFFTPAHIERFTELCGEPLVCDPAATVFGKFRVALATRKVTTSVHLDHVDWSAIIYLSPSAPAGSGLTVYKHRDLGLARLDRGEIESRFGCSSKAEFDKKYVRPISTDMEQWKPLLEIPYQYNRLILLRSGSLFHGIAGTFGDSISTGRLTHSFFMECG